MCVPRAPNRKYVPGYLLIILYNHTDWVKPAFASIVFRMKYFIIELKFNILYYITVIYSMTRYNTDSLSLDLLAFSNVFFLTYGVTKVKINIQFYLVSRYHMFDTCILIHLYYVFLKEIK